MEPKQLELLILRTLREAQAKGTDWIDKRIEELLASKQLPIQFPPSMIGGDPLATLQQTVEAHIQSLKYSGPRKPLGDAVVEAVAGHRRFVTARFVETLVRWSTLLAMEPDERIRRRKVSQALYAQRIGERLVARKFNERTVWGLEEWTDLDTGHILPAYWPAADDQDNEDSGSADV